MKNKIKKYFKLQDELYDFIRDRILEETDFKDHEIIISLEYLSYDSVNDILYIPYKEYVGYGGYMDHKIKISLENE